MGLPKRGISGRVSAYCLGLAWTGTVHANEPAFAVAMEIAGLEMDPWDDSEGMATAINMENVYDINVLRGEAKFRKNGADCDPVVIHFSEMPIS